jgi:phosphoglycolate phosphatase
MLLELMDELSCRREQTLMIGDTSHDLEMARAAEVDAVAVTYGAHPEEGCAPAPLSCVST